LSTDHDERELDELARQLMEELLRRGESEQSAQEQVAAAMQLLRRAGKAPSATRPVRLERQVEGNG
jgi:hypothetical protein